MRRRRAVMVFIGGTIVIALLAGAMPKLVQESFSREGSAQTGQSSHESRTGLSTTATDRPLALSALDALPVKGRAVKTGYTRAQFGDGWGKVNGCTTRNIILHRDLRDVVVDDACKVVSGKLDDPYTGEVIAFTKQQSSAVQIDHVVALSDAWQKGAQALTKERRIALANDPLELLAVDGPANQAKGDGDAATWLPKNKAFRCEYVARQIAVKKKYSLWVTSAEKEAIVNVLSTCPQQVAPIP